MDHMNLVKWRVKFYANYVGIDPKISYDDLLGEGYLTLVKVLKTYDQNKSKFSTYLICALDNNLRRYINSNSTPLTTPKKHRKWLLDFGQKVPFSSVDEGYEINYDYLDYEYLLSCLKERERYIVEQYFIHGRQMKDIGKDLKISSQRVSEIITLAKEKMRKVW